MMPGLANLVQYIAIGTGNCADKTFLGLLPWYHYLRMSSVDGACEVQNFHLLGANSSILLILLALIDDLLRVAGLLAVIFVIYAGIKYITSQGSPDKTAAAQRTIMNALIGLVIAVLSIQLVAFLGNQLAGTAAGGGQKTVDGATLNLSGLPNTVPTVADGSIVQTVLAIIFGIVGALSFAFLVMGGFKYIMSHGDPQAIGQAKNTIMYALIGLAVAIAAESLVSLVVGKLGAV